MLRIQRLSESASVVERLSWLVVVSEASAMRELDDHTRELAEWSTRRPVAPLADWS